MTNTINPGDGLVIAPDGKIDFVGTQLNIEVKQIDTSAQTTIPSVFIKKSNTVVDHGSHKDYDNVIDQLTVDCMDPNWADINHTIPIPNNYILQKYNGQITWETIGSVQIDSLDVQKLYSATNGFLLFTNPNVPGPTILSMISNQYISSLDWSKVTSVPSELFNLISLGYDDGRVLVSTSNNYSWQTTSALLGVLLTQLQTLGLPPLATTYPVALSYTAANTPAWSQLFVPNALVNSLNTQTYIITSNMQSNSINGDRLSDNTIDFETKLFNIPL